MQITCSQEAECVCWNKFIQTSSIKNILYIISTYILKDFCGLIFFNRGRVNLSSKYESHIAYSILPELVSVHIFKTQNNQKHAHVANKRSHTIACTYVGVRGVEVESSLKWVSISTPRTQT